MVLSGGVFQNELLLEDFKELVAPKRLRTWSNRAVPPNDGGSASVRQRWLRLGDSTNPRSCKRRYRTIPSGYGPEGMESMNDILAKWTVYSYFGSSEVSANTL
jgi:hypothetical protein